MIDMQLRVRQKEAKRKEEEAENTVNKKDATGKKEEPKSNSELTGNPSPFLSKSQMLMMFAAITGTQKQTAHRGMSLA